MSDISWEKNMMIMFLLILYDENEHEEYEKKEYDGLKGKTKERADSLSFDNFKILTLLNF